MPRPFGYCGRSTFRISEGESSRAHYRATISVGSSDLTTALFTRPPHHRSRNGAGGRGYVVHGSRSTLRHRSAYGRVKEVMRRSEWHLREHRPLERVWPAESRRRIGGRGIKRVLIERVSELLPPAGVVH